MTENSLLLLKEVTPLFKKPKEAKFDRGVRIFIYYKKVERQHEPGAYDVDVYFKVIQPKELDRLFETDTSVPATEFFFLAKQWTYELHLGTESNGDEDELVICQSRSGRVLYSLTANVSSRDSHFIIDSRFDHQETEEEAEDA